MTRTIKTIVRDHERWRGNCINLMASENVTSPVVREILASDLGHRYTLPINDKFDGVYIENAYRGTRYTDESQAETERLARKVFGAKHAYVNALSGHIAVMTVLLSVCGRRDLVMAPSIEVGGYHGWVGPYLPAALNLRYTSIPFNRRNWDINYEKASKKIMRMRPQLVVIGLSYFPFPFDMAPIREACDKVDAVLCYDASHILGLVAGGKFQRPLKQGADVMIGSTHKTFFGPQGGLLLTNRDDIISKVKENVTWRTLDNAHWNRVAALGQALTEMKRHGKAYAGQVVKNSKALAVALDGHGIPLRFKHRGFTESHQVIMDQRRVMKRFGSSFNDLSIKLEKENIIIDSVGRLGTPEVTRLGMKESDMATVVDLMVSVVKDGKKVKAKVKAFRKQFSIKYR